MYYLQDLLKTQLSKLLPLKVVEVLQIMEGEFLTQCNRILSLWNNLCNHYGLCIKWTYRAISLPNAPISVLDWIVLLWVFFTISKHKLDLPTLIHRKITAACNIGFFYF